MLSSSLYLFVSKVVGFGIRIILPVFLVRVLPKEQIGIYSQFFLLELLIKTIFQMGINQSLFFFIPRDRDNAGAYFINSLILNVLVFLVAYTIVWFFRDQIAAQLGMSLMYKYFWYLASYSLLMMLNVAAETYLTAHKYIIQSSLYSVMREFLASVATLYAAFTYRDLEKIFLALIVSRGLTLVLAMLYIHMRLQGFRAKRYFFGLSSQIKYGFVLGAAGTIGALSMKLHELAVSREFSLTDYAVYAQGCKQIPILQFFTQSVSVVALSQFAALEKKGDWDGIRKLWDKVLTSMYGVGIPVTIGMLLVSKPLVILMFTKDYAGAVPIFQFNTVAMMALVLNPTLVLRAMDRNDVTLRINALVVGLMPFAFWAGIKMYGMVGVIAAHTILILSGKVFAQFWLNRLSPQYLPYLAPRRAIWEFYRTSWRKGLGLLKRRR